MRQKKKEQNEQQRTDVANREANVALSDASLTNVALSGGS